MIPLVDLKGQYASIKASIDQAIARVIERQFFIGGTETEAFEKAFAAAQQSQFAIGCSNGTSAITLTFEALGIGPGDEVITTPHTFIASAAAIIRVGATPVFADIDPETYTIDPAEVERKITPRTKAILPVHLYGNPCNMHALRGVAKRHNLLIVEDSAQAHLSTINGKSVGSGSAAATFSFYPGKNLGAYGDAGAVTTDDPTLAAKIRATSDHGRTGASGKYTHEFIGANYRMDELQAAVLSTKLAYLGKWTERRREIALKYDEAFRSKGFKTIREQVDGKCVYHLYVVEVSNRHDVQNSLKENGIATGIHYPIPLHLQPAFAKFGWEPGSFKHTETAAARILSLPMCPQLTDASVTKIVGAFLKVAKP